MTALPPVALSQTETNANAVRNSFAKFCVSPQERIKKTFVTALEGSANCQKWEVECGHILEIESERPISV